MKPFYSDKNNVHSFISIMTIIHGKLLTLSNVNKKIKGLLDTISLEIRPRLQLRYFLVFFLISVLNVKTWQTNINVLIFQLAIILVIKEHVTQHLGETP